jgi:hypothetical protein
MYLLSAGPAIAHGDSTLVDKFYAPLDGLDATPFGPALQAEAVPRAGERWSH